MEKALETLSKQQLLTFVKEQSQVHSKEMAFHKKELQKTEEELKRSDEYLRKYVSKSGILEEKVAYLEGQLAMFRRCLLYTSPSPRDGLLSRMPSSA